MKAIMIDPVNKELLNTWGESEELTWENSFKDLIRAVLVVDETIPQGYSVMRLTDFYDKYQWKTNMGTYGWSEINTQEEVPMPNIYILWDMNADSWTGSKFMKSIHATLDGAINAIPENLRKEKMKRDLYPPYVANYGYFAVEERQLEA